MISDLHIDVSDDPVFDDFNSNDSHSPHRLFIHGFSMVAMKDRSGLNLAMDQFSTLQERCYRALHTHGYYESLGDLPLLWFMSCREDMHRYISSYFFHVVTFGLEKRMHPGVLARIRQKRVPITALMTCLEVLDVNRRNIALHNVGELARAHRVLER